MGRFRLGWVTLILIATWYIVFLVSPRPTIYLGLYLIGLSMFALLVSIIMIASEAAADRAS
jgi:hypothetical protein